jgi:very-short-patch-repair endonuclease
MHRSLVDPRDRTRRHGVPVTTPARTLLDFAEVASARELERAWDEAHVSRLVRAQQVTAVLERASGRRGSSALVALMKRDSGPALTKREAEERMLAIVRAADLPPPEVNARVGPYEVDLLWRAQRLVIEIDSWQYHSKSKFESDRERDDYLQAHRFRVMRVTWRWIVHRRDALIARVAAALAARAAAA